MYNVIEMKYLSNERFITVHQKCKWKAKRSFREDREVHVNIMTTCLLMLCVLKGQDVLLTLLKCPLS